MGLDLGTRRNDWVSMHAHACFILELTSQRIPLQECNSIQTTLRLSCLKVRETYVLSMNETAHEL